MTGQCGPDIPERPVIGSGGHHITSFGSGAVLTNDATHSGPGNPPARWKCHVTKVLYIEHDDDNIYMLKMRFERVGDFEVLASDGSERGCQSALTERPDVILMDLEMPGADCWEIVRRLKKDAQTGHIPIIGMSAYALDSEREQAIATGCSRKNFSPTQAHSTVEAVTGNLRYLSRKFSAPVLQPQGFGGKLEHRSHVRG
jgi:CheY-like chemotaxis protein